MMTSNPRRALDRWARDYAGYANFDTFIRTGGGIIDARRDIGHRIESLGSALQALRDYPSPVARENPEQRAPPSSTAGPEALARAEVDQHGDQAVELGGTGNAQVQGEDAALRGDDHV